MKKDFINLKNLFLLLLFVLGSDSLCGQQNTDPITSDSGVFFEFKSTYPTGDTPNWTASGSGVVAEVDFLRLSPGSITSPLYKSAENASLTFYYDVAAYGNGKAGSLTVLSVYEQGNGTPVITQTLASTNGSTYVKNQTFEFDAPANPFYVVIEGKGDGVNSVSANQGTRLQNFSLKEVVISNLAEPTFTPDAGIFYESATVTLSAPEADAIYYTTDVTKDPTREGKIYSSSLTITETTTIKAVAKKGTDFSRVVTAVYQIKKLTAALPYSIDFKNEFGDCILKKVSGDAEWEITQSGTSINGDGKGTCENWLILPAVTAKSISFNFLSGKQYQGPGLQLLYSADYDPIAMNDPNQVKWTDITHLAKWPATSDDSSINWSISELIILDELDLPVRIAFKYTGDNNSAALWAVGDVTIVDRDLVSEVMWVNGEVSPSGGVLAKNLIASGEWTSDGLETLGAKMSDNPEPITSVKFTGSVASDAYDIIYDIIPNCLKIFADGVTVPDGWVNAVQLDADGNGTSESIVLDATYFFGTPVKITAANASFTRKELKSGNKSTIYLPFAATLPEGCSAYAFNKVEGLTAKFTPVNGSLAANVPYLFIPNESEVIIEGTNVEILPKPQTIPTTDYEFLGTYEEISAVGFYGFSDNSFKLGIGDARVPSFRAYLKPAVLPSGAPQMLSIGIAGGATGVENVAFEGTTIYGVDGSIIVLTDQSQVISIYDADGKLVRMETVNPGQNVIRGFAKGIYIANQKKVIVK